MCEEPVPADAAAAAAAAELTGFEGAEKRLEVDFFPSSRRPRGLRALSRAQLNEILVQAKCEIVSERHAPAFDAYVLSESSLFVYSTKLVLKTCGTTTLLIAAPTILALAAGAGLVPRRAKYTRACYKYPALQPFPHRSWAEETAFLNKLFGHLGEGPTVSVLGAPGQGLMWHTYTAEQPGDCPPSPTCVMDIGTSSSEDEGSCLDLTTLEAAMTAPKHTFTFEVCMTELAEEKCKNFFHGVAGETAAQVTVATGIRAMFPDALIDDFQFEPCGYSMNGLQDSGFMTIHVTPEQHCSYASVEISGHKLDEFNPAEVLAASLAAFKPAKISVALSGDVPPAVKAWASAPGAPEGYTIQCRCKADLAGEGYVSYVSMAAQ